MDKIKYSQPNFYKLNQDSLNLVRISYKYFLGRRVDTVLDLAAGSGVVGIEFHLKYNKNDLKVHFLEEQTEFIHHLKQNISNFNLENTKIFHTDMFKHKVNNRYDLILCNPPYFIDEKSRKSPNENKNKCRILKRRDLTEFFKVLKLLSVKDGYICLCCPKESTDWKEEIDSSSFMVMKEVCVDQIRILILQNIESFQ